MPATHNYYGFPLNDYLVRSGYNTSDERTASSVNNNPPSLPTTTPPLTWNAPSLVGLGEQTGGSSLHDGGLMESLAQRVHVVAVYHVRVPPAPRPVNC